MLRRTCLTAFAALANCAIARDESPATAPLTPEEMRNAAVSENLSLPNPAELFAAFNKLGKPDWSSMVRKPPSATYTNRSQLALNLGALIADGYLAVETQEKQQVKNISREIRNLAKGLGLEQDVGNRSNSIADFADARQWGAVDEELEAMQNELSAAMDAHQDRELVTLMALGGWLRTIEIVSGYLAEHYTPEGARALRQPAICGYFAARLRAMPQRMQAAPQFAALLHGLRDLQKLVSFPPEVPPSAGDVRKLSTVAGGFVTAFSAGKP
jgi:hypothetical protein